MSCKPIIIENLSFELPQKTCFTNFGTQILPGEKIAVIGKNGAGKSSLLKILLGQLEPSGGVIKGLKGLNIGYVPQTVLAHNDLSGGQRFNKAFSEALSSEVDMLILDEPTNHLDQKTRYSLMRMLNNFAGILIVATHDTNLINQCTHTIWHIDNGQIIIFSGNYADYIHEQHLLQNSQEKHLELLQKEQKALKVALTAELKKGSKAAKTKPKDNNKMAFKAKVKNGKVAAENRIKTIRDNMATTWQSINNNRLPEILVPKFILTNDTFSSTRNLLTISGGTCGYDKIKPLVAQISFSMTGTDKVAFLGDNGSGKTTLLKAILGDAFVYRTGVWELPHRQDIGYIDQHYANLSSQKNVEEIIKDQNPCLTHAEIRKHLNDYLFRKNEEVFLQVQHLSGGEKARVSLAQVAAKPPKLLILDEITNNVDIETKEYILSVLSAYPGAFIIISHEADFLQALPLTACYSLTKGLFNETKKIKTE